ncbi:MAG: carboxypeptidase M32 [Methanocellales archaeon]
MQNYYEELLARAREIAILKSIISLLQWDLEAKMPQSGIHLRKQQLAMLSKILHKRICDPEIKMLLNKIDIQTLSEAQKRNVYLIRKNYEEQVKLPEKLISETAEQRAATIDVWRRAKAVGNFDILKPELMKLFELKKQMANILMEVKSASNPYEALIDIYEPKVTINFLTKIFEELKRELLILVEKYRAVSNELDAAILKIKIPVDIQRQIARALAKFFEYDIETSQAWGRIDESEHPFTSGYYHDIRITTKYHEDNYISSIFSILHEVGHALYEHNLNPEFIYQPIGTTCSFGFEEAQARFLENIIGRSREFWSYFHPRLKKIAGDFLPLDLDGYLAAINQIKPTKIRIEADEVTYNLHILIRFEIELDLFAEKIKISELPQVWDEKYLNYLGLKIENDREGVLQDIHWASGYFGYFPSYALGNLYSAQILSKLERELNWREQIAEGSFQGVKKWLVENIYTYGNLYDPLDLIKKITGEELSIEHYLNYLKNRYAK